MAASASRSDWDSSLPGPQDFGGIFSDFDESFRSFDSRMANMQHDFEVARQQVQAAPVSLPHHGDRVDGSYMN